MQQTSRFKGFPSPTNNNPPLDTQIAVLCTLRPVCFYGCFPSSLGRNIAACLFDENRKKPPGSRAYQKQPQQQQDGRSFVSRESRNGEVSFSCFFLRSYAGNGRQQGTEPQLSATEPCEWRCREIKARRNVGGLYVELVISVEILFLF